MDFKTRRIRKFPKQKKKLTPIASKLSSKFKLQLFGIAGTAIVMLLLLFGTVQLIKSIDFGAIIFSFGQTLQTDEQGNTNILLVGVGGKGHDGTDLTDSIILASIDHEKGLILMISIPRDFYVDNEDTGRSRINSVYYYAKDLYGERHGMNVLKDTVSEITGLPIQYYVKIDFNGFVQIVDSLEGVDVLVEESIYDPYYPKDETIYFETFSLPDGLQHLDGETALKYARSRKTTSDFDRAKRQQQLLHAIKDRALSLDILTNPGKIKEIYDSVRSSIDTNLTFGEIIELAKIAKDLDKTSTYTAVINDDPTNCGGLVYTPAREFFGGASVLLPAGNNYDYIHFFVDNVLNNVSALQEGEEIQIRNGTKTAGLAYEGMTILSRFCLNVVYYSNAKERDLEESTIYYKPGPENEPPKALDLVKRLIPAKTQAGIPEYYLGSEKKQDSVIVIELGKDYLSKRLKDPFDSLKYLAPPTPKKDEDTSSGFGSDSSTNGGTDADTSTAASTDNASTSDN